jgi:hypothetical protein
MEWLSWELLIWPLWGLAVLLVIVGVAGTVLPILPGVQIMLVGFILLAWLDGFVRVGWGTLLGLTLLTLLATVIDFIATAEGARRFGAGRLAILGATLGLLVGLFFGLLGILVGPFVGAVLGHAAGRAGLDESMRAGVGASIGVVVGTLAGVAIGGVMLVWFGLAWWL